MGWMDFDDGHCFVALDIELCGALDRMFQESLPNKSLHPTANLLRVDGVV